MADSSFKAKVAFIVETDGLLKDYLESIVIKNIKSEMIDDAFKNVSSNHLHAALILKNISPCALKQFAEAMRMSKAAASALVERMVKSGLVLREVNPENRREVLLSVNPDFDAHVSHVRTQLTHWFEILVNKMGMESFEKWHNVMVTLNKVLQDEIKVCNKEK
ncbi:helix-turn-helix transcriptional regulator [Syntrophotalea carbinolica DSM 2380]|uniref:Helix-turn-helix transcriptional regulator n=1 Tax=Syntrophotalea carbinolica (strain DSM 2380 / NBRC 103641 / GraBd1) TaxID=338963 RepID=Q3A6G6_SYNC1|nr:MarR family transcriptional regulator [Syntrophotalea carbinolica]ABA88041.1 helix-turn-helix transcriptional regulator [Syntrophotalea carbinolica DSM 2380]